MDRPEVVEHIRSVISELLNHELPALSEDDKLTDLGLDSTGVLEMLMELEQRASFEVDADAFDPDVFVTIGSLTDYIMRVSAGR